MTQGNQIAIQFQNTVNETDDSKKRHQKPTTYHLDLHEPTMLTFLQVTKIKAMHHNQFSYM